MKVKTAAITVGIIAVFASTAGILFVTAADEIYSLTILETTKTIIGQDIQYPADSAKVTSKIVTIPSGVETGWHTHDYPLYAYIMEGEIDVDYGDQYGVNTYKKGDSFVEAVNFSHNGMNRSNEPVEILLVLLGKE